MQEPCQTTGPDGRGRDARRGDPATSADHDVAVRAVERGVSSLAARGPLALAVSGGRDSMVLLEACARTVRSEIAVVATFDHGTGAAAGAAAEAVASRAAALGLPMAVGRASQPATSEAAWRAARWRFLREVAAARDASVVTAHTADDQAETVFMRALRGAGARGLAGLRAPSAVLRPFLELRRWELVDYARARGVVWVDDPSNVSRAFLRNRARLDMLPALERVRPGFALWLLELGDEAAAWRAELDALLPAFSPRVDGSGRLSVAAEDVKGYDAAQLAVLWPALAALAGVTLDRRGTRRLAEFTMSGAVGGRVQLSGGFEVVRRRDAFALRPMATEGPRGEARSLRGALTFGAWRFRPLGETKDLSSSSTSAWQMELPAEGALTVRAWRPGDRMRARPGGPLRRVKRFFAEAGIAGMDRAGWPVVVAGSEIVWIPGVRRGDAATTFANRPGRLRRYLCERDDRPDDAPGGG